MTFSVEPQAKKASDRTRLERSVEKPASQPVEKRIAEPAADNE